MKYKLLIHQGDTPTPSTPEEWANDRARRLAELEG